MSEEDSQWGSYFWEPGGAVLRNRLGVRDRTELELLERRATSDRTSEIMTGSVMLARTFDAAHLRAIHQHIFQDVYDWAGQHRTVNMGKVGAAAFAAAPAGIEFYMGVASNILAEPHWARIDQEDFVVRATVVFALVNHAHPFREGNGRSSRVFMQHVAERSGFTMDYTQVSAAQWNAACAQTAPAAGEIFPRPGELGPIFKAIVSRAAPSQGARTAVAQRPSLVERVAQVTAVARTDSPLSEPRRELRGPHA
jgi:cell filamentation protein